MRGQPSGFKPTNVVARSFAAQLFMSLRLTIEPWQARDI
jgi:hypothetical protein